MRGEERGGEVERWRGGEGGYTRYTAEKARSRAWTDSKLLAWGIPGAVPVALVRDSSGRGDRAGRRGMRGGLWDASFRFGGGGWVDGAGG